AVPVGKRPNRIVPNSGIRSSGCVNRLGRRKTPLFIEVPGLLCQGLLGMFTGTTGGRAAIRRFGGSRGRTSSKTSNRPRPGIAVTPVFQRQRIQQNKVDGGIRDFGQRRE